MTTVTTPTTGLTTWNIDATHSHVEFAIRHLMIATVRGRFTDVRGTVTSHGDDPSKGEVDVHIGVASVDTRDAQRDAHLRSAEFFEADKYPEMTFRSLRITDVSGNEFKLTGNLTIRGVTREITFDVTSNGRAKDPWGGERSGFSATGRIKRGDFGLTWNQALETGGVLVGDDVRITLDVELVKAA